MREGGFVGTTVGISEGLGVSSGIVGKGVGGKIGELEGV